MEAIEQLRSVGIEELHAQTHITRQHLKAILAEDFSGMTKVQLFGFLSILEREYAIDLSDLRADYLAQYPHEVRHHKSTAATHTRHNYADKRKPGPMRKNLVITTIVVAMLFAIYTFYIEQINTAIMSASSQTQSSVEEPIEIALPLQEEDENLSSMEMPQSALEPDATPTPEDVMHQAVAQDEAVEEDNQEEIAVVVPEAEADAPSEELTTTQIPVTSTAHSLSITPKRKLWMGLIDLDTGVTSQKVTTDPITLDGNTRWLIMFAHGLVDLDLNGVTETFNTRSKLYFVFENGQLRQLDVAEYNTFNNGRVFK